MEHAEHESAKKVYVEPSLQERDRLVEVAEGGPQRIGITTGNV